MVYLRSYTTRLKMLVLDIELKYNPIHRLFNKQVVPGVGELNKYEEKQELRKWTSLKMFLLTARARIQLYSAESSFFIRLIQKELTFLC